MIIKNQKNNRILATNGRKADSFLKRLVGLLGRNELLDGEALLIPYAQSIHTLFMRFPIDLIFLDKNNCVVKIIENLVPWRMTRIYWGSTSTLECAVGTIRRCDVNIGDQIQLF